MQRPLIVSLFIMLAAAGGVYAGFSSSASRIETLARAAEESDRALSERLAELESTLLLLASDTADIRTGQQAFAQTQTAEKQALSEALEKLSVSVSSQESELAELSQSTDVSGLIASWSPFVYNITCSSKSDGITTKRRASAVLEQRGGGVRFITNRHVVDSEGKTLVSCELTRPGRTDALVVEAGAITLSDAADVAYGSIAAVVPGIDTAKRCSVLPTIGDAVVMLGFPQIGARESITATEGIISGFDEDYYATSAKIEKGNSGGAAIDVKRNCFLGLPTLVFSGRIESLARILPVTSIE